MNRSLTALIGAVAILLWGLVTATPAQAQSPIQIALVPPVQLVPETSAVEGLRLSIYGRNAAMTGIDIGVVNETNGPFKGVQFGLVGLNEGRTEGVQFAAINITTGNLVGAQISGLNYTADGRGLQASGSLNFARNFEGLQIALVNYAETLDGVQIGLVNIIRDNGFFPVFPIFNFGR